MVKIKYGYGLSLSANVVHAGGIIIETQGYKFGLYITRDSSFPLNETFKMMQSDLVKKDYSDGYIIYSTKDAHKVDYFIGRKVSSS